MKITLAGQRPTILDPVYIAPLVKDYDAIRLLKSKITKPLFTPLTGQKVEILDNQGKRATLNGHKIGKKLFTAMLFQTLGDKVAVEEEEIINQVYSQGLVSYDGNNNLLTNMVYLNQAANQIRPPMPAPSNNVIYTSGVDVIPSAKALLADAANEKQFFVSLGYTYKPQTLGFWFQSSTAFNEFKTWFINQTNPLVAGQLLDPSATSLIADFAQMELKTLTEGVILRKDANDQNQEGSFARLLVHMLMSYQENQRTNNQEPTMGVMPFHVGELFLPQTIVFANVEAHGRASARKVDNEWRLINAMLGTKVRVIPKNKLAKLTAMPRAQARAKALANARKNNQNARAANVRFRKKSPTTFDITEGVVRALKRMKKVNRSQNVFKKSKTSYLRANRRHPDDPNRPGRIVSVDYYPDLHVFLDTSGSISERNYQDSVMMLIRLAKKLNVNIYFSSFSHMLSQPVLLKTKDKSVNQIWKEFRRIPKVTGGTEYTQVWDFINQATIRKDRLNLIITDFEWWAPARNYEHPKNLYYAPVSGMNWNIIKSNARSFARSMRHIDPAILQKMIGVTV